MAEVSGAELVVLFEKASKAAERAIQDGAVMAVEEVRCVDALKAMGAVKVSTALLISTQVGKQLCKLTKHKSSSISSSAEELLDAWWKKVVTEETLVKTSKVEFKSVPKKVAPKPEKVASIPKRVAPKPKQDLRGWNDPSPKVESKPCLDPYRNKFRLLLLEAFKKCCKEVSGEDLEKASKTNLVRVSVAVENAVFSSLGLSNRRDKARYRSIIFNLKDDKNPDFRRRVLLGEIQPEEIMGMTTHDMASDARKKENDSIRENALFNSERALQNVATTEQFKCGKCHQRKTTYFQLQTRSADEPITTFVQCVNCNNRWKC